MSERLNSLRMRAERGGKHISGAERLLAVDELERAAVEMLQRAVQHSRGRAEKIFFHVDPVAREQLLTACLLDLHHYQSPDWQQGRELARRMLISYGISPHAVDCAMRDLAAGAAPGGQSMRGAMLIDADSGARLEPDPARGVRVSRMDLSPTARNRLCSVLADEGLNNAHVIEALTLATKVVNAPGVIAELCWSDDPDYPAGYVAAEKIGYQRISLLKPVGEERGGRAFFVRCAEKQRQQLVDWLERQPFLIDRIGCINPPELWSGDR